MPSDDTTVATQANFVPMAVGKTDRDRSFSGVLAHDERSPQPRPEVHPEALNVLINKSPSRSQIYVYVALMCFVAALHCIL